MTSLAGPSKEAFKRALVISGLAHAALLLLIVLNPSLPKARQPGLIRYISLGSFPGGGGSGGLRGPSGNPAETKVATTELKKNSLRDLTTLQKLQQDVQSSLRYPTDKPKSDRAKPKPEKQASVSRPDPKAKASTAGGTAASGAGGQSGGGTGVTIGAGGPGFGEGPGLGGYGNQIGMSNFPYTYYLQNIQDRISARWFQSLVDPGVSGSYRTTVHFRIFRNGSISDVDIKESSGLTSLDLSAKRAVVTAAPFPPLPPDYDEPYLGIILIFEHTK